MTISHRTACIVYALIGVCALVATWGNVIGLMPAYGFWGGTLKFWHDVLVNESSRFITADTLFLGLAVVFWMVMEARRLSIPFVWAYVFLGLFVAISFAVPMFMIHRQAKLAAAGGSAGEMRPVDAVLLFACAGAFVAFSGAALLR